MCKNWWRKPLNRGMLFTSPSCRVAAFYLYILLVDVIMVYGILLLLLALRSFTCYQLGAALWQLQCGDVYSDLEALSCSIQRLRAGSAEIGQIVNGRTFCFPYFDLVKRTFGGWTKQKSSPPNHDLNWQRYKIDSLALSCRTRTSSNSMHFISLSSTIIT